MPTIIRLGEGRYICNWGAYEGLPAVFIEPVHGAPGKPGELVKDMSEPAMAKDAVTDDGIIISFADPAAAEVLIRDIEPEARQADNMRKGR